MMRVQLKDLWNGKFIVCYLWLLLLNLKSFLPPFHYPTCCQTLVSVPLLVAGSLVQV